MLIKVIYDMIKSGLMPLPPQVNSLDHIHAVDHQQMQDMTRPFGKNLTLQFETTKSHPAI